MATYDTWGGSWGTSWGTSWTRTVPVPTVRSDGSGVKKKPVRVNLRDGKREDLSQFIKGKLREQFPEQAVVEPVIAQKPKKFRVKDNSVAIEAMQNMAIEQADEERRKIEEYNRQVIQLILLAASE